MKKQNNYARFFALIKRLPGNPEELKENLVLAFTNGRTRSLRDMYADEYDKMCDSLQGSQSSTLSQKDFTAAIKKQRSAVLKRMQKMGVDTSDWAAVDEFCLNPRIAGKEFRQISLDELSALVKKLEAISSKPKRTTENHIIEDNAIIDQQYFDKVLALTRNQVPS